MSVAEEIKKVIKDTETIIDELLSQINIAIETSTPLISFVVSPNTSTSGYFIESLDDKLKYFDKYKKIILRDSEDLFDLICFGGVNIVFGIHNQPELVRKLNWRRESISSSSTICVFVITFPEYTDIINRAPDFWDFRNSVAFVSPSNSSQFQGENFYYPKMADALSVNDDRINGILEIISSSKELVEESVALSAFKIAIDSIVLGKYDQATSILKKLIVFEFLPEDMHQSFNEVYDLLSSFIEKPASKKFNHLVKKSTNESSRLIAFILLSNLYVDRKDLKSAGRFLQKALLIAKNTGNANHVKRLISSLRLIYLKASDITRAINLLDEASNTFDFGDGNFIKLMKADLFVRIYDSVMAISTLSSINIKSGDYYENLTYNFLMCIAHHAAGDSKNAEKFAIECMELAKLENDWNNYSYACSNAARTCINSDQLEKAQKYLEIAAGRLASGEKCLPYYYSTLGDMDRRKGDLSSALQSYKYAFSSSIGHDDRLQSINNIMSLASISNLVPKDQLDIYMTEGEEIYFKADTHSMNMYLFESGSEYLIRRELDIAVARLRRAHNYFSETKDLDMQMQCAEKLANAYFYTHQHKEALKLLRKCEIYYEESNNIYKLSQTYLAISFTFSEMSENRESEKYAKLFVSQLSRFDRRYILSYLPSIIRLYDKIGSNKIAELLRSVTITSILRKGELSTSQELLAELNIKLIDVKSVYTEFYNDFAMIEYMGKDLAAKFKYELLS